MHHLRKHVLDAFTIDEWEQLVPVGKVLLESNLQLGDVRELIGSQEVWRKSLSAIDFGHGAFELGYEGLDKASITAKVRREAIAYCIGEIHPRS